MYQLRCLSDLQLSYEVLALEGYSQQESRSSHPNTSYAKVGRSLGLVSIILASMDRSTSLRSLVTTKEVSLLVRGMAWVLHYAGVEMSTSPAALWAASCSLTGRNGRRFGGHLVLEAKGDGHCR